MLIVLSSIIPVFAVILLGQVLRRAEFPKPLIWQELDRLNYFVLMPALLVDSIATADFSEIAVVPFAAALLSAVASMMALLAFSKPLLGLTGPQYASFFQATTRWNGFVALATIAALYGSAGLGPAGLVFAVIVPFLNIMSVVILARNATATPPGIAAILILLARNPLIQACAFGIFLNASSIGLPGVIGSLVDILSRAALTLGLLSVGAALNLAALHAARHHLSLAAALKLLVMPLLMLGWCAAFGVDGIALSVAIVAGAVPTATASYTLSRQLGGDAEFMASLITATTLSAAATMPLVIALLG